MASNPQKSILQDFKDAYISSYEPLTPRGVVTIHQKALFLFWFFTTVILAYRSLLNGRRGGEGSPTRSPEKSSDVKVDIENDVKITTIQSEAESSNVLNKALLSVFICGLICIYYFFCDYLHYFSKADRTYNRDLFMFLSLLLFLVGITFTSKVLPVEGKLLNRDQTEEWKGWMQVMFVWYHYFKAAETYNAVRIYIACYVWMTGFGNFSFFWIRSDFSLRRMFKMLFRLNFLVVLTCVVINNEYMLYYICPMHTFWFLTVYAMMRPFHEHNKNKKVMITKFIIYFLVVFILYDINMVAEFVFRPLSFILKFRNSLHEWIFRTRLDHFATFIGMICAYNHPNVEKGLYYINNHKFSTVVHSFVAIILLFINYIWYKYVFVLPKYEYNKIHPYTSFIPMLSFILLRNLTPWLRNRYIFLFTTLGKITLETYISQLHVYLQADAKAIIAYIPGYPLINFALNTLIYLYVSHLLFKSTLVLNDFIFPAQASKMWKNIAVITGSILFCYGIVFAYNLIHI